MVLPLFMISSFTREASCLRVYEGILARQSVGIRWLIPRQQMARNPRKIKLDKLAPASLRH